MPQSSCSNNIMIVIIVEPWDIGFTRYIHIKVRSHDKQMPHGKNTFGENIYILSLQYHRYGGVKLYIWFPSQRYFHGAFACRVTKLFDFTSTDSFFFIIKIPWSNTRSVFIVEIIEKTNKIDTVDTEKMQLICII